MSTRRFADIGEVVMDEAFAPLDLALRRGEHVHRDREEQYEFLSDAQELLEAFYARYGCELVHRSDGYFFLLPTGDALPRRQMSVAEMIVGQALALSYLDPATVQSGGHVTRDEVLGLLSSVMGTDALVQTLNPTRRRRVDERVAQKLVRQRVAEALRRLSQLGFVDLVEGDRLKLCSSLMRFAEPVRGLDSPAGALRELVARGEVRLEPTEGEGEGSDAQDDAMQAADADTLDTDGEAEALDVERDDVECDDVERNDWQDEDFEDEAIARPATDEP
jgi:chromosome partition protein MukE